MPDYSEAALASEIEGETPQSAVMHAASRLPLLSHFEFGHDQSLQMHSGRWGGDALSKLSQFAALRHCKLDSVCLRGEIGEVPAHVHALAGALRSMPHLESLQLDVIVLSLIHI